MSTLSEQYADQIHHNLIMQLLKQIDQLRTERDEARKFIEDEAFVTLKARMWLEAHPKGNDNE